MMVTTKMLFFFLRLLPPTRLDQYSRLPRLPSCYSPHHHNDNEDDDDGDDDDDYDDSDYDGDNDDQDEELQIRNQ